RHLHLHTLHSFPTRRSSDLSGRRKPAQQRGGIVPVKPECRAGVDDGRCPGSRSEDAAEAEYNRPSKTPDRDGEKRLPQAKPEERSEEHTSELQSRFDLVCRL